MNVWFFNSCVFDDLAINILLDESKEYWWYVRDEGKNSVYENVKSDKRQHAYTLAT